MILPLKRNLSKILPAALLRDHSVGESAGWTAKTRFFFNNEDTVTPIKKPSLHLSQAIFLSKFHVSLFLPRKNGDVKYDLLLNVTI